MLGLKTRSILVAAMILIFGHVAWARWNGEKIEVQPALRLELNAVLEATSDLQVACYHRDEKQIETALRSLMQHIDRATQKSNLAASDRPHLVKILSAAKSQLELSQMRQGEARAESLKEAFSQLVQIARVFKLDPYRIFFCPKDRAVWLQKGWTAQNPVNPDRYGQCGKLAQ